MEKPKLIIFADGEREPGKGGSGAKNLIEAYMRPDSAFNVDVRAVFGRFQGGGVETKLHDMRTRAERPIDVPFVHIPKEVRTPENIVALVHEYGGEGCFVALSGCLWQVPIKAHPHDPGPGLDPRRTCNIHPGDLTAQREDGTLMFGGAGMWGHHVHEAAITAFRERRALKGGRPVVHTAVSMHFATQKYDEGPLIFWLPLRILPSDMPDSLGSFVNANEHRYQPWVTDLVVNGKISWSGRDPKSLVVPMGYEFLPRQSYYH